MRWLPLLLVAGTASAGPRADWTVVTGELADGAAYVLTTDAAPTSYSYGRVDRTADSALPVRVALRWRRLDGEDRAIEIRVAGAVVLVADGKVGVWVSDARFNERGFEPFAAAAPRADSRIEVAQTADAIDVAIDGAPAMHYPFAAPRDRFHVGVALKAARGVRGRLRFTDVTISP